MKRTKRRHQAGFALSVLGLTLIAPWVFGQDPDPLTEIRRCARERKCQQEQRQSPDAHDPIARAQELSATLFDRINQRPRN